jgi:hypothetical protein
LKAFIATSKSKNWRHKFSSKFRSRARHLDPSVAAEIVSVYERLRRAAARGAFAVTYLDAIPSWPNREVWSKSKQPWLRSDRIAAYKAQRQERKRPGRRHCGKRPSRCR